ncbi:MAG: lipoate protein ligase C-terminal domain-containing protein [Candidatus Nanohaloarchaea archaeon]|nr:lipoate protein ligase C-terminal domain-containing protein [Candidatus Nanohaloarchaea archaeon]
MTTHGKASVKVPEGKLVKLKAEVGDRLKNVNITGDFFLQPPEALEELENALEGMESDIDEEKVLERLEKVDAQTIGFDRKHIVEALRKVVE